MKYLCDLCGGCCRTFPIYVSAEDADREPRILREGKLLAEHLESPGWKYQLFPLPFHETCTFLGSDNHCHIYEARPEVCRRFDPGSEQCQEARNRLGLARLEASIEI
jgi:Fe-S-cluster containining protein